MNTTVRDADSDAGSGWYIVGAAGLLGGARLVKEGALQKWRHPWLHGVLGGFSAGAGLALLALLQARRLASSGSEEGGRTFVGRVVKSIPFKVRNAAAVRLDRR